VATAARATDDTEADRPEHGLRGRCACEAVGFDVADEFVVACKLPMLALPGDDRLGVLAWREITRDRSTQRAHEVWPVDDGAARPASSLEV
jgi:hypothetical protein